MRTAVWAALSKGLGAIAVDDPQLCRFSNLDFVQLHSTFTAKDQRRLVLETGTWRSSWMPWKGSGAISEAVDCRLTAQSFTKENNYSIVKT